MRTVRRHLSHLVFAWLVCQVSAVTAAPLLLTGQELCTCPDSVPGAACPMHHAHQDPNECVLRSAAPASTVTLAAMMGGVGVIPPVQVASTTVVPADLISALPSAIISRAERPESPPPRS
jgi:hypothetical protein